MPLPDPPAARRPPAQALSAWHEADTAELMAWADTRRQTLHGPRVTYTHSLNLNPTNICRNRCGLCAFWREPEDPPGHSDLTAPGRTPDRTAGPPACHSVPGSSRDCATSFEARARVDSNPRP